MTGEVAAETPHWFVVEGVQDGRRTLDEQMIGLHPALAEARGKSVLDLGCAEGLIALEFAKAGARVTGYDYNGPMIVTAERMAKALPADVAKPAFVHTDIREAMRRARLHRESNRHDIVLALAVVHKLPEPAEGVTFIADSCNDLAVFRLPHWSTGDMVKGKHSASSCNVNQIMGKHGFRLEKTFEGPRREPVQYWRRIR